MHRYTVAYFNCCNRQLVLSLHSTIHDEQGACTLSNARSTMTIANIFLQEDIGSCSSFPIISCRHNMYCFMLLRAYTSSIPSGGPTTCRKIRFAAKIRGQILHPSAKIIFACWPPSYTPDLRIVK